MRLHTVSVLYCTHTTTTTFLMLCNAVAGRTQQTARPFKTDSRAVTEPADVAVLEEEDVN